MSYLDTEIPRQLLKLKRATLSTVNTIFQKSVVISKLPHICQKFIYMEGQVF